MAWQYGVAQTVPLVTYAAGVPTAPTNPVATLSKAGAGFVATTNAVVAVANGACHVTLSATEMQMAYGHVKVTSDNCDPAVVPITTEADWTAARAGVLTRLGYMVRAFTFEDILYGGASGWTTDLPQKGADFYEGCAVLTPNGEVAPITASANAIGGKTNLYFSAEAREPIEALVPMTTCYLLSIWSPDVAGLNWVAAERTLTSATGMAPTVEEIEAEIAAQHGTGRYDHAGAISVQVTQERVIADPADLLLIRGDTPQEVTFVFTDAETAEPIDPTAWDDWYLTIKPIANRDDEDDDQVITEVAGVPGEAASGAVSFEFDDEIDAMERDCEYDYDIEARTDAGAIRTFRVGVARLTHDVRRGSA